MTSGELLVTSTYDDEQIARQERCKQWVLDESSCAPRELASWEGSIRYDSGTSARLESYPVGFDSVRSMQPLSSHALKTAQNIESWTSARSPTTTPALAKQQDRQISVQDCSALEAFRTSIPDVGSAQKQLVAVAEIRT